MSDPRVPEGEIHTDRILDPEGVDPDLLTDEQRDDREREEEEADKLPDDTR